MAHTPMAKVHIVGHRRRLDDVLALLHRLGVIQLIDVTEDSAVSLPPLSLDEEHVARIEELRYLRTRIEAMRRLFGAELAREERPFTGDDLSALRASLEELDPEIERLMVRIEELESEQAALPRYVASLRKLLPLAPALTELESYETAAVLIDFRHADVLGDLNASLSELIGANFAIISDRVDADTLGAILVFPRRSRAEVEALLGRQQVSRVRLPERFENIPFRQAIVAMERRLAELPAEIETARRALTTLGRPGAGWQAALDFIDGQVGQLEAIRHLGATPHTFILSGWVPRDRLQALIACALTEIGPEVVVTEVAPLQGEEPPVLLANPKAARPFEFLVRLLALPRYGAVDPTVLMMIFLPLFFGIMLGDVGYGLILLLVAVAVRRRFGGRSPLLRDLTQILTFSAAWTVVWGVIYAEFFGDLGRRLWGVDPIWLDREEALRPLLLFAVAVGAGHVVLGLLLGAWEAARRSDRRVLTQRLAMLVALAGLFVLAGVAAGRLPSGFVTPAVAGLVVALAVLIAAEGALGLLTAPLELIGTVGNVLSYLRLGAIGLASVYLARVANELGTTGPLWLGFLVAALFHALNVVLGAFSPTIQALRLHYVEFFGKFYEEGGVPFRPFGERPPPSDREEVLTKGEG